MTCILLYAQPALHQRLEGHSSIMNFHGYIFAFLIIKVYALTTHNSGLLGVGGSHHIAGVISNVFFCGI